jgi:hypothetical protein
VSSPSIYFFEALFFNFFFCVDLSNYIIGLNSCACDPLLI